MSFRSFLKSLWTGESPPRPPQMVEVDRVQVTVRCTDEREFELHFDGQVWLNFMVTTGRDWHRPALSVFEEWRVQCGREGTVPVGGGRYVPLCNVKEFVVRSTEERVTVAACE